MSTRSRIGIYEKGTLVSIYCHWDGYPEGNGQILFDHYQDRNKIIMLMQLWDISNLDTELEGCKSYFGWREEFSPCQVNYIPWKDRKPLDFDEASKQFITKEDKDEMWEEYYYVYDSATKTWFVSHLYNYPLDFRKLEDVLKEIGNND